MKEKRKVFKKLISVLLCLVLVLGMMCTTTGCNGVLMDSPVTGEETGETTAKSFVFVVTDVDGSETTFDITSDKEFVGEALMEEGLIEGEEGAYGLYVKTVNGITYDFDKDGKYWAFYVDGEYAMSGVDTTEIEPGITYEFRAE